MEEKWRGALRDVVWPSTLEVGDSCELCCDRGENYSPGEGEWVVQKITVPGGRQEYR